VFYVFKINVIIEDGKKSDPKPGFFVFNLSWNTPVIASYVYFLSKLQSFFDLDGKKCIQAYDLYTQQLLLGTRRYSVSEVIDYAISPNGDGVVVLTEKKIELYTVSSKKGH